MDKSVPGTPDLEAGTPDLTGADRRGCLSLVANSSDGGTAWLDRFSSAEQPG